MKIDGIVLRELHIPLLRPFETSFGVTRDRRVLLAEIRSEGLTGWGECTAGEHPHFSYESTDTAWHILLHELGPSLAAAEQVEHGGEIPTIFKLVRGHRMAKATLENAIWDLEAQREGITLASLLGGVRDIIPCGVSLGIQKSIPDLLAVIEKELAAGYQRIKLKCKPGWDVKVFEAVRNRFPGITLSCDANSAYRLRDADHVATWDAFDLLMIEQPMWHDDFFYHSILQKRLNTPICLDESINNRRDALAAIENESCRIINIKLGRVGGFSEAIAVHNACLERGVPVWCGGMLESGIGRSHNIAISSLENYSLPGDVSASARYWKEDIIEPEVTVTPQGEIILPDTPGRGYEVRYDLIERLTVRKEIVRSLVTV
ncbi:o-succinylbenzoate synthase [Terracidiphilus gabretensis]|jgi:O-succinylbenzoate synthase|uniref:o-succinylbenzoate synthase n=1 Tax=Terracidiphilus gabretensis TaxID=1577687 RepID=UPI00071BA397|nr:o-succinylbenzoate synthase [Terracidiphilus gabretensis]